MNHIYRLIWDELRGAYVAVAEIARRRGKRAGAVVRAAAAVITIGGAPLSAYAMNATTLPSGAQVVAGNAQLNQQGSNLTVHQDSQRAILNWNSFDIGSQASVRFEQPNSSAVALNRVLGGSPSQVLGGLSANGQVWLVNPSGVVFGKSAQVDVAGLVASSLSISDNDFLAGRARFAAAGTPGAVRNEGTIRAQGGVVALLAPVVGNAGTIAADQVGLGAGNQVALDFGGDGMLSLAVDKGKLQAEITQSGLIRGNNVVLSASGASALHSSVINMDGVVEATGLSENGGHIVLDGGDSGAVHVSGTLDASSTSATGGNITVTGNAITLDGGATLNANGATGGGTIKVGGGLHGEDASVANAQTVNADSTVTASADAMANGNGGQVVFWSDGTTTFGGKINIRGGAQSGDGGQAEVSGKQDLTYSGVADARAAKGATGDLLLDPDNITVMAGAATGSISDSTVTVADLEAQTANVTLQAGGSSGGFIHFDDLALNGGDGHLTMQNNVGLRLEVTSPSNTYPGSITFDNAANTIEVSGTGYIYMQAGTSGGGSVGTTAAGVANLIAHGTGNTSDSDSTNSTFFTGGTAATVNAGTPGKGSITILGADGITLGGAITTNGGYVRLWADSDNAGGGGMDVNKAIATDGGNLYVAAGDDPINLNSDMTLGAGRIVFKADGTHTLGNKVLNGLLSASGDVTIDTPFTMGGQASIYTNGNINFGAAPITLNTGTGVLVLRANAIDWGSATLTNLSTASIRLEPYEASTNMVLGDASGFASATTLNKLPGIQNLTIGRPDGTGTITVSSGFGFNAWGSFELEDKNIAVNAALTNTNGNVTLTGDTVGITDTVTASTSTGSTHAAGTAGAGKVTIRQMTTANPLLLGSGLKSTSVGEINAATLELGRTDGGDLVFNNDISTNATSVALLSGGKVLGVDGGVSAANLAVYAGDGATISSPTFDFTTLALTTGANSTSSVTSSKPSWALGTVDGYAGLNLGAGSTSTLTAAGTLNLNAGSVNFNNGAAGLNLDADKFTGTASVSNQGAASVVFDQVDHGAALTVGASASVLPGTTLTSFNGTKNITIGSDEANVVTEAALAVTTGTDGTLALVGDALTVPDAITVTTGSLKLDSGSALGLAAALTASNGTVTLHTNNQAITGSGVITADDLVIDSGTGDAILGATQQVNNLSADAGSLTLKNGKSLTVNGVAVDKTVDLRLSGGTSNLALARAVTAHNTDAADTAILLAAGGDFVNDAGSTAVSADSGRWLIYSTNPTADTPDSLAPDFKQYGATTSDIVLGSGNGFLYTVAPTITVSLTGTASKEYDGTQGATLTAGNYATSGAIDGDDVTFTAGSTSYDTKNVGTGKTVTADDVALTGASNGGTVVYGYTLSNATASGAIGIITPKTISLHSGSVEDKVYDGTTTGSLGTVVSLDGVVTGDDVSFAGAGSVAFADTNAGSNKQVNVGGVTLDGADKGNYQFDSKAYADIDKRTLTVDVAVDDKVYDGKTDATLTSSNLDNLIEGDDVSLDAQAQFTNKNVGANKNVVVTASLGGTGADNYVLDATTGDPRASTASITPKTIDAGTLSVAGKVYDGSRDATVNSSGLAGEVSGDDLSLVLSGQYDNKNVGTGKQVAVSLGLTGGDAGNYQLANTTAASTGSITQKIIDAGTLSVAGKVYDGSRDATVKSNGLVGVVAGDDLALDLSGQYDNKNAGTGKQVDVSLGLSGGDAGNYQLANTAATSTGNITAKTIDAGTLNVAAKVYDGSPDATVSSSGLVGVVAGDDLALDLSGQYDNKNAGTGKRVAVSLDLSGGDADNYQLANTSETSTGSITPKTIDAGTLDVAGKVYDGSRNATVNSTGLVGVVSGDDLSLLLSGQYDNKNVGTGKQVAVSLGLGGGDAGNYRLANTSAQASGDVAARELVVGAVAVTDKPYDGSRNAELVLPALRGLVGSDDVALQGQGQFDTADVAANKTVQIALSLSGADAANYRLVDAQQQTTAIISDLPGRNAVDSISQSSIGGNGTLSGATDIGAGTSPGAIAAAAGAMGDLTNSAQPQLGGSSLDPSAGAVGSAAAGQGAETGAGADAMASVGRGAGTGDGTGGVTSTVAAGDRSAANGAGYGNDNGTHAGTGAGVDGTGSRSRGGAGSELNDFATEQVLRNGEGVSISLDSEPLAEPQVSVLPVFTEEGQLLGRFRVDDLGDSLALHPVSGEATAAPKLEQQVRARAATRVQIDENDTASLHMELLEDGTLHIMASANAAQLGRDTLAAYGLSALKRQAGVSPQQVRAVVLGFAD